MSNELSVGGKLAKAATALLHEMDPDTFLHGIEPLKAALEGWAMAKTTPNDTALRRAGLYLDGLAHNGCNEVKTLRRLIAAAQLQGEPVAWATVFRKPGALMKIEVGPENHEKNSVAGVWGWTTTYQPLFLNSSVLPVVPSGWKLVPIRPTTEMLNGIAEGARDRHLACGRALDVWSTMLDAVPPAPGTGPLLVDLPAFDGYQAHIVKELQAAFVQACENANIKVKSPEVKP